MTNKDLEDMKNKNLEEEIINGYPNARNHFDSFVERQPKTRTIDDLECGDYVVDNCGNKRRCLGKCGEICFLSRIGNDETSDGIGPLSRIKSLKYTLYQPTEEKETDIDKCIKVVEKYFEKLVKPVEYSDIVQDGIIQALKNLKK